MGPAGGRNLRSRREATPHANGGKERNTCLTLKKRKLTSAAAERTVRLGRIAARAAGHAEANAGAPAREEAATAEAIGAVIRAAADRAGAVPATGAWKARRK
jgi:hypothetical protein